MSESESGGLESIDDVFLFLSAVVLLIVALIFFQIYLRYRNRDHLVMGMTILIISIQMVITKLHFLGDSGFLDFFAGLFSLIIAIGILFLLISPKQVSSEFEQDLLQKAKEE